MIGGVPDFPLFADDDSLRSRTVFSLRGMDVFFVVSGGLSRQAVFAILKRRSVIAMLVFFAPFNAVECRFQVDRPFEHDSTIQITNRLVLDDQR